MLRWTTWVEVATRSSVWSDDDDDDDDDCLYGKNDGEYANCRRRSRSRPLCGRRRLGRGCSA